MAPRRLPLGILRLLVDVRYRYLTKSLYTTLVAVAPSFSSYRTTSQLRLALPSVTPLLSFPGTLTHYPTDFGKRNSRCVYCLVVNTLISRVGCPFQRLADSSGKEGPRDRSMYADNELRGTVWTRVFSQLPETPNRSGDGGRAGG